MPFKVTIDAGHGGFDIGNTYEDQKEKDQMLALALLVGQILSDNGIDVTYTRTIDVYQRPAKKAEIANMNKSDLLVSLHRGVSDLKEDLSGVRVYVYNKGDIKEEFAKNIEEELSLVGYPVIGTVERPNLIILNQSQMPSLLIEIGFMDQEADNCLFEEKFYETGKAIARGIIRTITK